MKKYYILIILVLLMSICVSCKTKSVPKTMFLIDIVVKNEEQIPVQYLALAMVTDEGEYEITKATQGDKGFIHFAISYAPDEIFVLTGKTDDGEVEKFYFDLKDAPNVYQRQELVYYLQKRDDKIIITEDMLN